MAAGEGALQEDDAPAPREETMGRTTHYDGLLGEQVGAMALEETAEMHLAEGEQNATVPHPLDDYPPNCLFHRRYLSNVLALNRPHGYWRL